MIDSRLAHIDDASFILDLIKDLATFEKAPEKVTLTLDQLITDGFGENPLYESQILLCDGERAGFFLYYYRYSTWKGRSLYLEDLYVIPKFRRKGLAKLAFKKLAEIAVEKECGRFEWQVLDWNEDAIKFYESFQTEFDGEWINCRLEEGSIKNPLLM